MGTRIATNSTSLRSTCAENLDPSSPILFLFITMILGSVIKEFLKVIKTKTGIRLPYSVGLICIGIALGSILYQSISCEHKESYDCINEKGVGTNGQFQETMLMWMNIPGNLILFIILPPLIYEGSAYTNVYKFSKHFLSGVVLAGPGVVIQTALIGCVAKYVFPYNWGWVESFLFGGILSATDPIAVIALLKELGCLPDLRVLIEAESILNDGTAIVVYELCHRIMVEPEGSIGNYVGQAFKLSLGGPAMGIIFCIATMLLLSMLHNPLLETTVTIAAAYLCFFTAQGSVAVSGVLAVMTLGVLLTMYGQAVVSHEAAHFLHVFWSMVEFMANTVIFVLAGSIIIFDAFLLRSDVITARDWGFLVVLYLLLNIIRLIMLLLLSPYVRLFGYRLTAHDCSLSKFLRYMVFAAWGGLRGVVAVALALTVFNDAAVAAHASDPLFRERVLFQVSGIVALTLLINGPTAELVILALALGPNQEQARLEETLLADARFVVAQHAQRHLAMLRRRNRASGLTGLDWDAVRNLTVSDAAGAAGRNGGSGGAAMWSVRRAGADGSKNRGGESGEDGGALEKRASIRLYEMCLVAVRSSYEEQFADHLIGGAALRLLAQAANCADDFIQAQKSRLHAFRVEGHADDAGASDGFIRRFDVGWIPSFGAGGHGRGGSWWAGAAGWAWRLVPSAVRAVTDARRGRSEVEAVLAACDAYGGLDAMLADKLFRGHTIRGQVADVRRVVELRAARLQHEQPELCAAVGARRAAVGLLKASREEVQRLHDAFLVSDADCEALLAAYKRSTHKARYCGADPAPSPVESLVAVLPPFRALPSGHFAAQWAALCAAGATRFAKGEQLTEAGRPSNSGVCVMLRGVALVFDDADAVAAGRFACIASMGCMVGCADWLAALGAAFEEAGAEPVDESGCVSEVISLCTVVAETEVEAVLISGPTFRALVVSGGPVALAELWRSHGGEYVRLANPALLAGLGFPAGTAVAAEDVAAMFEAAELCTYLGGPTEHRAAETRLLISGRAEVVAVSWPTDVNTDALGAADREFKSGRVSNSVAPARHASGPACPAQINGVEVVRGAGWRNHPEDQGQGRLRAAIPPGPAGGGVVGACKDSASGRSASSTSSEEDGVPAFCDPVPSLDVAGACWDDEALVLSAVAVLPAGKAVRFTAAINHVLVLPGVANGASSTQERSDLDGAQQLSTVRFSRPVLYPAPQGRWDQAMDSRLQS